MKQTPSCLAVYLGIQAIGFACGVLALNGFWGPLVLFVEVVALVVLGCIWSRVSA